MVYSLSRFQHSKPAPPFELGGQYEILDSRHYLKNAVTRVELVGALETLQQLKACDLIVVEVKRVEGDRVHIAKARIQTPRPADFCDSVKPHAARFAQFLNFVRQHFLSRGFSEVLTPTLVKCPGLEPSLEPFATEITMGREKRTAYLPTSPEIHLKKSMPWGWTDIFEIKNCFRKGEFSSHHDAEFTMLEWYRGFADLELIESDLRALLTALSEGGWIRSGLGPVETTDFASLFRRFLSFELSPKTTSEELSALCRAERLHFTSDDSFNDLFHRLLIDRIEPKLPTLGPTIVRRFPPSQAALAKLDENGWADRFEFYWRGLEIANAFNEVSDPAEQEKRWAAEKDERRHLGTSDVPADPGLIEALRQGVPPSGGVALGLERLYMACAEVQDIGELKWFSPKELFV